MVLHQGCARELTPRDFLFKETTQLKGLKSGLFRVLSATMAVSMLASAPLMAQENVVGSNEEIQQLKTQLAEQQKQLAELRSSLLAQQALIERASKRLEAAETHIAPASAGMVASLTPVVPVAVSAPRATSLGGQNQVAAGQNSDVAPLSFRIGIADFTPLGFMDLTSVSRSADLGGGIASNFGAIPYGNATTVTPNIGETRFSTQNSRVGLRIDSTVLGAKVLGYLETDFLGAAPANLTVTSNSNALRMRLFFVDVKRNGWELTGGQMWSLMTPGRKGISPIPGDIFFTQNVDTNYQAGLVWSRDPGIRLAYHAGDKVHFAVAAENPEQYIGGGVTLPSLLATPYASEFNSGNSTSSNPNLIPDLIAKVAFDSGSRAHLEFAGVARTFKSYNPLSKTSFKKEGVGGAINFNIELVKNFRFLSNNYASDGGGRYIANTGTPDLIVNADGSMSLVHSGSTVDGVELQATKNTLFYAYYGGTYIRRAQAIDSTGKLVGYGFRGSSNSNNRTIQEGTLGMTQVFWKNPRYGALQLMLQYSYLSRSPYSVIDPLQPRNADLHMGYANLRYVLP